MATILDQSPLRLLLTCTYANSALGDAGLYPEHCKSLTSSPASLNVASLLLTIFFVVFVEDKERLLREVV